MPCVLITSRGAHGRSQPEVHPHLPSPGRSPGEDGAEDDRAVAFAAIEEGVSAVSTWLPSCLAHTPKLVDAQVGIHDAFPH